MWYNINIPELKLKKGGIFMLKGHPNKQYSPEFKIKVIETMHNEGLSHKEAARKFEIQSPDLTIEEKYDIIKSMSKSKDLREVAVAYKKAGNSYEDTGKVFGVSASTEHKQVRQYEETGDLSNKHLNRGFKKIDPEKLKAYIAEHPDDTQQEVATVFGCCNQAISQAYRRLGITRKKRHSVIKNRTKKK